MEVPRTAFRAMIFYDYKRGLTYDQSHQNLGVAFGDNSPSLSTVSHWFREFKRGRCTLEDELRPGRSPVAVCAKSVSVTQKLLKENRNITHREIQQQLSIGSSAVDNILHQQLGVRKLVCVAFCYTTIMQLRILPQKR